MIRNGNMELSSKEEMIRFLKMQLVEEKRQLEVMRNALKDRRAIEQEVVTLQIQVDMKYLQVTIYLFLLMQYCWCTDK